jgi:transposase
MGRDSQPSPTSPEAPNIAELRKWLEEMIAALRFFELVTAIVPLVVRMRDLNTELVRQVATLRRRKLPSEKLARVEAQLVLAFPGLVAPTPKEPKKSRSKKGRENHPGRSPLPAHLPRIVDQNPVPPARRICPVCGSEMTTVGHTTCETLDLIPAQLVVRRRIDETVACPHDDTIVSAAPPLELLPRSKLTRRFVVEALLDKYVEHLPLERQCTKWRRSGADIATQTLGRNVARVIDAIAPLTEAIHRETRASAILSTDASGLRVLDPEHPMGVRSGTVWCWIGDARWVSFFFAPEAGSEGFKAFLDGAIGRTIQCDGTNVTTCVERAGGKRPGCWSNGRRRFVEAARGGDVDALEGLRIIRRLFAVERLSAIAGDSPVERAERREKHSRPALEARVTELIEQRWPRARYDELLPVALAATCPELRVASPLREKRLAAGATPRLLPAEAGTTSSA